MLDNAGTRQLAYVAKVTNIAPMNAERLECVYINGWTCVCGKGDFHIGDVGVFFEPDSQLPEVFPFTEIGFLASKHYKIKPQKIRGVISQGLFLPLSAFVASDGSSPSWLAATSLAVAQGCEETIFLTNELGVTYAVSEDNHRKAPSVDKYKRMAQRHPTAAKSRLWRWLWHYKWGKKLLFFFFGKKRDKKNAWPVGRFPGVNKTDQERVENMTWILQDKTPFIRTQKCDGSSGTYILERKGWHKYEFYVCSRNVRMMNEDQECFYGSHNYYWEVADKYHIYDKMKEYLDLNREISFVCWQGEICAPDIQGNPHNLTETHFYCFHCTDSKNGRWNILDAQEMWKAYNMEVVPIDCVDYIMPDDFEEFKKSADGKYDSSVCEGNANCDREGYVYYKTDDPTFSFKNVSREYLVK